jgi:uncharacterized membrane protein YedE/YeeE
MMSFIQGALTGALFGAVLYKVGAVRYSRIMGMLTLRDVKIMKFTFATIGTASLLYGAASIFGVAESLGLVPRTMPFLGGAHVLGGMLFGVGMGVSGLCPGTCVAKAGGRGGSTKFSSIAAMVGLVVGVLLYNVLKDPLTDVGVIATNQKPYTIHGLLGLPYGAVAVAWGALFFVIATLVDRILPEKGYESEHERKTVLDFVRAEWSWLAGGIAAGLIIVAATAQDGYLGFSGALLALVGFSAHLVGHPLSVVPAMSDDIMWRAALIVGVFPGALFASLTALKSAAQAQAPLPKTINWRALFTSFSAATAMCFGAMLGGGCTTGAYLAAWPTLSVGSLVMGGTFFAVSMATSNARLFALKTLDVEAAQATGDRAYD